MNPFDLPGPQFLLFYTVFSGIVLGALVFWRRHAELSASPARIDLSDPYLIAYLRGGEKEVLRVAQHARVPHPLTVILERDGNFPPIEWLLDQLDRARSAVARGRARQRAAAA